MWPSWMKDVDRQACVLNSLDIAVGPCAGDTGCASAERQLGADGRDAAQKQIHLQSQKSHPRRPDECQARHATLLQHSSLMYWSALHLVIYIMVMQCTHDIRSMINVCCAACIQIDIPVAVVCLVHMQGLPLNSWIQPLQTCVSGLRCM